MLTDTAIVNTVLPQLYAVLNELLDHVGEAHVPKPLLIRCKRLLPAHMSHSFERPKEKASA